MADRLHVASFSGRSGISRYAADFHESVLSSRGFQRVDPASDSVAQLADRIIARGDEVHVEVGVNEPAEIALVSALLRRGCGSVDVTLHDPPFLRWPYFQFRNRYLNGASKFVNLYLNNLGFGSGEIRRLRRIFVLTEKGARAVISRHRASNVHHLPFVLRVERIADPRPSPPNLLFFGFIAANKGLDYALDLHSRILARLPETRFLVVGDAIDPTGRAYLDELKRRFATNVEYCGFVDDSRLQATFDRAAVVVLPFRAYRSVIPASASVLGAMARGKAVFTTDVNAVNEFVDGRSTGGLLTGIAGEDASRLAGVLSSRDDALRLAQGAVDYLRTRHSPEVVGRAYDQICVPPA